MPLLCEERPTERVQRERSERATSPPRAEQTGAPDSGTVLQSCVEKEDAFKRTTMKGAPHFIPFKILPTATMTDIKGGNLTDYTNPPLPWERSGDKSWIGLETERNLDLPLTSNSYENTVSTKVKYIGCRHDSVCYLNILT